MNTILVMTFLIPFAGGALAFLLSAYWQRSIGLVTTAGTAVAVGMLTAQVLESGSQTYHVGGWIPPLGIQLRCDGLSLLMLLLTAVIGVGTSLFSMSYFANVTKGALSTGIFWPLWLFLWGGMNCLFLSGDIFNLYLLLEFTLLASVAMASLGGSKAAMVSALRYLLSATAAALFYLLGVSLLYAEFSTLDILGLKAAAPAGYLPLLAMGLMVGGLALKCALFPLHFWLPAAHSTAPAPVSALLSGVVVKCGFYVIMRIWFDIFPATAPEAAGQLMAVLGAVAIVWGSWQALRQDRLKMLIAYSTVAQIGYLFLLFPLIGDAEHEVRSATTYQIISHGLAKAGMFLAAGTLVKYAHSDLLAHTRGAFRKAPFAVLAMVVSGAALAGIAPGGGAKGNIIGIAMDAGQWWWAVITATGMLLTVAYTILAVRHCFQPTPEQEKKTGTGVRLLEAPALTLAILSILASLYSKNWLILLEIRFLP